MVATIVTIIIFIIIIIIILTTVIIITTTIIIITTITTAIFTGAQLTRIQMSDPRQEKGRGVLGSVPRAYQQTAAGL